MSKNTKILKAAALKYNKEVGTAPKLVAKGKGSSAQKIIELAKQNNLPIKKDEDLVELLSKVELDKEVPENLYKAVAEVFAFVYKVTNESREVQTQIESTKD
ncbi:EscU/YscU/HrcU family type III secretion system export apparatus switch protein [Sulfurimonas sp. MAG313]|nr:EscU/YscU/HrcU family type III secretion system export apparatus switch protein [Sulfurimonas sp. MAG313]MDF1880141.1 EscU/YscU/HrcU family type III secretion system export apparatus switch protein [Sulfurimonas sp. MAG313]